MVRRAGWFAKKFWVMVVDYRIIDFGLGTKVYFCEFFERGRRNFLPFHREDRCVLFLCAAAKGSHVSVSSCLNLFDFDFSHKFPSAK